MHESLTSDISSKDTSSNIEPLPIDSMSSSETAVPLEVQLTKEALREQLPTIEIGNDDPLNPDKTDFPNVLYHGSRDEQFVLDDSITYKNAPVATGARSGRGLYTAAREVAHQFGGGSLQEILPAKMRIIDLASPEAASPMTAELRGDFSKYQEGRMLQDANDERGAALLKLLWEREDLISRKDVSEILKALPSGESADPAQRREATRRAKSIISRFNTAILARSEQASLGSFFDLEFDKNPDAPYVEIDGTIEYLVEEMGINGARTKQEFGDESVASDRRNGVVFWKLDKVGTRQTWEARQAEPAPYEAAA